MSVVSVRVPKELRERMKKLPIVWSKELREYIERRIAEEERRRAVDKIVSLLTRIPKASKGFATRSVREDRDR